MKDEKSPGVENIEDVEEDREPTPPPHSRPREKSQVMPEYKEERQKSQVMPDEPSTRIIERTATLFQSPRTFFHNNSAVKIGSYVGLIGGSATWWLWSCRAMLYAIPPAAMAGLILFTVAAGSKAAYQGYEKCKNQPESKGPKL